MRSKDRFVGSAYVRNSKSRHELESKPGYSGASKREDLAEAIALALGDELDSRGIEESRFDDDACDRFAELLIEKLRLVGVVKVP